MNLPNRLTLLRMVLVPFLVLFLLCDAIPFSYLWALLVFVAASLTDFFDGKIAVTGIWSPISASFWTPWRIKCWCSAL